MKMSLHRIRRGALFLGSVVTIAVLGYRFFGDYDWTGALWLVVVTISTVGYGEKSQLPPELQLFTMAVIVLGISGAAYTFGGVVEMMLEGEIDRALGHQRTTREIERLKHHVVVCGFGRVGQILAADLHRHKMPFLLIELDAKMAEDARTRGFLCIHGDATQEEILTSAGIARAKTLVTALANDAASVFITLTGRNLNRDIQIIARAEHHSTERKLLQAGANRVVLPAATGAHQMSRLITRPSTADLMAIVTQSGNLEVELDEMLLQENSLLVGKTVRESDAHRKYRLLVVAVKQQGNEMIFNPEADFLFQTGDILILVGRLADIQRFRTDLRI